MIEEFLGQNLVNTLSRCPQEHTELLTGPILPSEIRRVQGLKQASAPGSLGVSNKLMKEIAQYMMDILVNKMLFSDQMPELEISSSIGQYYSSQNLESHARIQIPIEDYPCSEGSSNSIQKS